MQKKIIFLFIFLFFASSVCAQKLLQKKFNTSLNQNYSLINIGNWQYWQRSDGLSAYHPENRAGGIFPKNTVSAIYKDGFLWGGYVQDNDPNKPSLRVGGQTLSSGTQPGWIKIPGNGIDPPVPVSQDNDSVRIYRVRSDIFSIDHFNWYALLPDAKDIYPNNNPDTLVKKLSHQYIKDWREWPGNLGAPYYDRNRNGEWDPNYDEPGIVGSDQTLWYVVNDLNDTLTNAFAGCPPIGIELQITLWTYKYLKGALGNTIFKRYRIINKSGFRIDSMYIEQFSDPNIGRTCRDYVGCDSVRNYGFSYGCDLVGYPISKRIPRAVGYVLLQGPVIPSALDTAIVNFKKFENFKNLPMTSFIYFSLIINLFDPIEPLSGYDYTLSYYNLLRGFLYIPDIDNPFPYLHFSGPYFLRPTKFPLNGDPVLEIGDIDMEDSDIIQGDRRFGINSGPFSMEPGEVQEIVIAIIGTQKGINWDYIKSVAKLQECVPLIIEFYNDLINFIPPEGPLTDSINEFDALPEGINLFILGENYPNPFNNTTNIRFVLYDKMNIQLIIFNNIGQKVKILHNGELDKGEHYFTWNGKDESGKDIPSGIYYLHLSNDKFRAQTKKMLYLK